VFIRDTNVQNLRGPRRSFAQGLFISLGCGLRPHWVHPWFPVLSVLLLAGATWVDDEAARHAVGDCLSQGGEPVVTTACGESFGGRGAFEKGRAAAALCAAASHELSVRCDVAGGVHAVTPRRTR
jgi:hypothetical protein